jgi:hypothetical protein
MNNAAKVLRTERLEVVDEAGKCMAAIGSGEDQLVGLTLYDKFEKVRMRLRIRENNCPQITIHDSGGYQRIRIFINKNNELKIQFCDISGDALLKLALDEDGQSLIELRDEDEETKIALLVDKNGKGVAAVFNDEGNVIGSLPKERDLLDYIGTAAQILKIVSSIAAGA